MGLKFPLQDSRALWPRTRCGPRADASGAHKNMRWLLFMTFATILTLLLTAALPIREHEATFGEIVVGRI